MPPKRIEWTFKIVALLLTIGTFIGVGWMLDDRVESKIKYTVERQQMLLDEAQKDRVKIREALARIEERSVSIETRLDKLENYLRRK